MNTLKRNKTALQQLVCDHEDTVLHRRVTESEGKPDEADVIEMCVDCLYIAREKVECQLCDKLASYVVHYSSFITFTYCDAHFKDKTWGRMGEYE